MLEQTADSAFDLAGEAEMKVVGHQDVAMDKSAALVGVMVEQGEELAAVLVGEKDGLPVVPSLGDVEGVVRGSESWFARHLLNCGFRRAIPLIYFGRKMVGGLDGAISAGFGVVKYPS